ncbi:E3 ubiquitin-protein ligase ubr4, partial [Plakobranchus ocellatus]
MNFFNVYLLASRNANIRTISRSSITQDHVTMIAQLTKDLDKECARLDSDKGYASISVVLARFNHNLVATNCLSTQLQDYYLTVLRVSPFGADAWSLTVYPRSLAVLVSVILHRQQQERSQKSGGISPRAPANSADSAVINVWNKFLKRLQFAIENTETATEILDDVNVEHMQVLLFLFHGLSLSQKKQILVKICQIIQEVAQIERSVIEKTIPLALSRLVLVFEYLLHYFYDPPSQLMEQVQHNLFTSQTVPSDKTSQYGPSKYFPCREVEENFRRALPALDPQEAGSMRPRFYNLCPPDPSMQETSRVDGLAVNVLLGKEYKLDYSQLYSSCVGLLMAGSQCDKTKEKLSSLDASAMHYHFLLLWRLLSCLPPSADYIRMLSTTDLGMGRAYRNAFASDPLPSESYIDAIHSAHMVTLSGQSPFCINASLRHVLQSLVRFGSDLIVWCPGVTSNSELMRVMLPLIYDVTTEYLGDMAKFLGPIDDPRFEEKSYRYAIQACDQIIVEFSDEESALDEKIFYECIKFMETSLEKPAARKAFKAVYTETA